MEKEEHEEKYEKIEERREKEKSEKTLEQRKAKIKEKLALWFRDPYNIAFVAILLLAFCIHLYYFFLTAQQPLWWDEAVYLLKAKAIAFGTPDVGVNPGRALVNSFLYALLYKVGATEATFKIIQILMSLITISLVYYIGKEIFNRKIGLFAAFVFSVFWVNIFSTSRFLPDTIGILTWMLCIFFFWKGYLKKNPNHKYLWLVVPMFVLAFYARETNIFFLAVIGIYLLFTEKLKFLKNKHIWISIVLSLLVAIPFFLYYFYTFGNPLANIIFRATTMPTAQAAAAEGVPYGSFIYFKFMPDYLRWPLMILLLIGLIIFIELFLGFDLFLKGKEKKLNKLFFIFLWLFVPFIFFSFYFKVYDERYIFIIYPPVFYVAGNGLSLICKQIKKIVRGKEGKLLAILVVILVLLAIAIPHLQRADSLIKVKVDSYWQIKEAGLWIKQNSNKKDIIFAQSVPQLVYYSERYVYPFPQNETEFEKKIKELKPKYMLISIMETHPSWVYSWPQKHNETVMPVMVYPLRKGSKLGEGTGGQVAAIIYQFNF